jgi:hypothetical protein
MSPGFYHDSESGTGWQNHQRSSCYLDVVHVNIAFWDCVAPSGYCHELIFFDQATRYNWVFCLKCLSSDWILLAFHLFWADVGLCVWCFWLDCDTKLFGTKIRKHLINSDSNIIAAVAGHQSANGYGLVEWHWKMMVHMLPANLTKKQMPRSFDSAWCFAPHV